MQPQGPVARPGEATELKWKVSNLLLPPLLAPLPPTASQHCFQCQIQALPREPSGWNHQGPGDPGFVGARFLILVRSGRRRYARSESLGPPSVPPQPPSLPPLPQPWPLQRLGSGCASLRLPTVTHSSGAVKSRTSGANKPAATAYSLGKEGRLGCRLTRTE